jgi:hypothetical protein
MSSATQLAVLLGLMTFATVGDCGERQLFVKPLDRKPTSGLSLNY